MKVTREEFLKEFEECFQTKSKLRFVKYLKDNCEGVVISGLLECKHFADEHFESSSNGEKMWDILNLKYVSSYVTKEELRKQFVNLCNIAEKNDLKEEFQNLCLIHLEEAQTM